MTCIVGLETDNGMIIGGDSAAVTDTMIMASRLKKVFKNGNFIFGYVNSFRMGQLLQYQLSIRSQRNKESDLKYLTTTFIDDVRVCLSNGGFSTTENEQELGGQFLIGYKGKLYIIDYDYQVNSVIDGYASLGHGASFALGCIKSTCNKKIDPKRRVLDALRVAAYFSPNVCPPFNIVTQQYS